MEIRLIEKKNHNYLYEIWWIKLNIDFEPLECKGRDGGWVYPPLEDMMTDAGLGTVSQYIATRPIIDLCLAANQRPRPRMAMRWWEHDGLELEGIRTADREAEKTDGMETTTSD